jgi:hypothetical protein
MHDLSATDDQGSLEDFIFTVGSKSPVLVQEKA